MKFNKTYTIVLIFSIFFSAFISANAQEKELSPQEAKLLRLEQKVQLAKDKVAATEAKLEYADSLMQAGIRMEEEANNEMDVISAEEKLYIKENSEEYKMKRKELKKADDDEYKVIEKELRAMQSAYERGLKDFEKRFKAEEKKFDKGKINQTKAKEKQKQYEPRLKDYQERLGTAETQLEEFKSNME